MYRQLHLSHSRTLSDPTAICSFCMTAFHVKKGGHNTLIHVFAIYWSIFETVSLEQSVVKEFQLDAWQCTAWWLPVACQSYFCHLWTKLHRTKFACAGVSVVCNIIFRLTMFCWRYMRSSCEFVWNCANIFVFGPLNFGRRGHPKIFSSVFSLPNLWGRLADCHRTLPHVQWWPRFITEWLVGSHNNQTNTFLDSWRTILFDSIIRKTYFKWTAIFTCDKWRL